MRIRFMAILVLLWVSPISAQIPVTDAGNLFVNTTTSLQSVISAVNSVTELIPLDSILVASDLAEDMALIGEIIADANGLMQDLGTLQGLFSPYDLPATFAEYPARVSAMNDAITMARQYSLKAQTLVSTLASTVRHLTGLIEGIGVLTGNMQANQTIVQANATISKTLTVLTVQTASAQRPESLEKLRVEVIRAMDREITRQYYAPWFEVRQ